MCSDAESCFLSLQTVCGGSLKQRAGALGQNRTWIRAAWAYPVAPALSFQSFPPLPVDATWHICTINTAFLPLQPAVQEQDAGRMEVISVELLWLLLDSQISVPLPDSTSALSLERCPLSKHWAESSGESL